MSAVNVLGVNLKGPNPAPFFSPFLLEITFECTMQLSDDLEWKVTYVGSSESKKYDQVLTSILVGPVMVGANKFVLETDVPNTDLIPPHEAIGITVILLSGYYREKEFVRVGYYVNNDYDPIYNINPEDRPKKPDFSKILRDITLQPRVTRFPIDWIGESFGGPQMNYGGEAVEKVYDYEEGNAPKPAPVVEIQGKDFTTVLESKLSCLIFQYLDMFQLGNCRRVSKGWKSIIDGGINVSRVDLSVIEWENEEIDRKMVEFIIRQCSPTFEELICTDASVLTDPLLQTWLTRGSELHTIDLSFSTGLTSKCLNLISEYCGKLNSLRLVCVGKNPSDLVLDENSVRSFCERNKSTIKSLHISGLTDSTLQIIASTLGSSLTQFSTPQSLRITDDGILKFAEKCTSLEFLGVELCNLGAETIKKLRTKVKNVRAWHAPADFQIEILSDEKGTNIGVKLRDWQNNLPEQYLDRVLPMLPKGVIKKGNGFSFDGPAEVASKEFEAAGFEILKEESDGEELGDEDEEYNCEICDGPEDEDTLVCNSCGKAFHAHCLEIEMPKNGESWSCEDCRTESNAGEDEELPKKKQKVEETQEQPMAS